MRRFGQGCPHACRRAPTSPAEVGALLRSPAANVDTEVMADQFEIKLRQGETYRKSFQTGQGHQESDGTWVIDEPDIFTDCHARMQIRAAYGTPVIIELTDVED